MISCTILPLPYSCYKTKSIAIDQRWHEFRCCISHISSDSFSVLAPTGSLKEYTDEQPGWTGLVINNTLDFSISGFLHSFLEPFARNKISVLVISEFDTDCVFFPTKTLDKVKAFLQESNILVADA